MYLYDIYTIIYDEYIDNRKFQRRITIARRKESETDITERTNTKNHDRMPGFLFLIF